MGVIDKVKETFDTASKGLQETVDKTVKKVKENETAKKVIDTVGDASKKVAKGIDNASKKVEKFVKDTVKASKDKIDEMNDNAGKPKEKVESEEEKAKRLKKEQEELERKQFEERVANMQVFVNKPNKMKALEVLNQIGAVDVNNLYVGGLDTRTQHKIGIFGGVSNAEKIFVSVCDNDFFITGYDEEDSMFKVFMAFKKADVKYCTAKLIEHKPALEIKNHKGEYILTIKITDNEKNAEVFQEILK